MKDAMDGFVDGICSCYLSEQGCGRLPVRMIAEMPSPIIPRKGATQDVDLVMACIDHAKTYKPTGTVIFDRVLSEETLAFYVEHGL